VSKDFGNSIRQGDSPFMVYSRLVEISENGGETDRPELAKRIMPGSKDSFLTVSDRGTVSHQGRIYKAAAVSASAMPGVDAQTDEAKASVLFSFAEDGCMFTREIVFYVIGNPFIDFPENDSSLEA
ncbi:MAG: hypothetical protein IJL80_06470, partial [Treponema sp.]|nr:hypothetical protein [Treponema sp.]